MQLIAIIIGVLALSLQTTSADVPDINATCALTKRCEPLTLDHHHPSDDASQSDRTLWQLATLQRTGAPPNRTTNGTTTTNTFIDDLQFAATALLHTPKSGVAHGLRETTPANGRNDTNEQGIYMKMFYSYRALCANNRDELRIFHRPMRSELVHTGWPTEVDDILLGHSFQYTSSSDNCYC